MISLTKSIFINENENVFQVFANYGLVLNDSLSKHLRFISHKQGNNYIGYFQFKVHEVYYKVYVLPKTNPKVESDIENKQNFIAILQRYYQLQAKYDVKTKQIDKSIIDFSFNNKKSDSKSDTLDDFITYQYLDALKTVKSFFKKYYKQIYKTHQVHSNAIKHKLDLKRNLTEVDKSRIHQTYKMPYLYSILALISSEVLNYFMKYKAYNKTEAKKVKAYIDTKYHYKQHSSFKINQIVSKKIIKLFKSNEEKALYLALLKLLGAENYFEDGSNKEIFKLYNQHALFFRPEKLFEWVVYEQLIERYGRENVKKEYLQPYSLAMIQRDSKPDFIVEVNNQKIIIDAKWKILNSESQISFEDVAKLRRDGIICGNVTQHILVYPKVLCNTQEYCLEMDNFKFKVEEQTL